MTEQGESQNVLELLYSGAAKEFAEKRKNNRAVLVKLLRSIYFLVKNRIPHTTTFSQLIELQVANGNEVLVLQKHLIEGAQNAQYTSKFSAVILLEAIDE